MPSSIWGYRPEYGTAISPSEGSCLSCRAFVLGVNISESIVCTMVAVNIAKIKINVVDCPKEHHTDASWVCGNQQMQGKVLQCIDFDQHVQ